MEGRCVFGVVHSGVAEVVEVAADAVKTCIFGVVQGDVAETVKVAFENSQLLIPTKKSTLSLQEVSMVGFHFALSAWLT